MSLNTRKDTLQITDKANCQLQLVIIVNQSLENTVKTNVGFRSIYESPKRHFNDRSEDLFNCEMSSHDYDGNIIGIMVAAIVAP